MSDKVKVVNSFPVLSILGLILVTLKLLGKISISWFWATIPFWGPIAVLLTIAAIALIFVLIVAVAK